MLDGTTLTTILTAAVAGAGGGVVIPYVNKILGPMADEIGATIAEHARIYRLKNAFTLFKKAQEITVNAGFEPKQVNIKTLLPLLEGASLEDTPSLADKWAALLANAANPAADEIKPVYAEILRQLTSEEAQLLDQLFTETDAPNLIVGSKEATLRAIPNLRKSLAVRHPIRLSALRPSGAENSTSMLAFDAMVDNLLRQRIIVASTPKTYTTPRAFNVPFKPDTDTTYFSSLGFDFMVACTPPLPK